MSSKPARLVLAIALVLASAPVAAAAAVTADPCTEAQPQDCIDAVSEEAEETARQAEAVVEEADDPLGASLERAEACVWVLLTPCVEEDAARTIELAEKNKGRALGLLASYYAGVCGDQEPIECITEGPSWPICLESYCVPVDPS